MSYTFLRWIRFGIAAALGDATLDAGGGPRARITVGVDVAATGLANQLAQTRLALFGPGDVGGIDARQVIRTFPVAGTIDFEKSYLAHVEFDRPDLPWLFTPQAPDANGLLRPWLCLVVAEKREGVALEAASPLPVLAIASGAAAELPSLAAAPAWAHVQITGDASGGAEAIARDHPERILSRLVCPRALAPDTAYIACVVPCFDVGVEAGLGRDVASTATLGDAWSATTDAIRLPVYHHWEFSTGGAGDFKSLVSRLQGRPPVAGVGTRALDVSAPGFGVTAFAEPTEVALGGALRVAVPAAAPVHEDLAQRLLPVVNVQAAVAPPIYGRWHAAATRVARGTGVPGWLDALNLDVRYRVAAGLGTRVVQERQEDLMAAVWQQFGEILRANQLLRQAQLAIAASKRVVARHLAPLPDAALLGVLGPTTARIRFASGQTVRRAIVDSCLPLAALSGAFRRIARTHGPIERRFAQRAGRGLPDVQQFPPSIDTPALIEALAAGTLNARAPSIPAGAVVAPASLFPLRGRRPVSREPAPKALDTLMPTFTRLASRDLAASCPPLNVPAVARVLRDAVVPDLAIPPRVRAQLHVPTERVYLSDRLDPVMAAPEIPTPMIGPLIELGLDWLLPGLTELAPNTVSIVEPDAAFIEAYFVGLNHEMSRELLWRGFPTDQRGTVFSRFWDRRGAVVSQPAAPIADIEPIAGWLRHDGLGSHLTDAASDLVVLLLRGDLLQRYPRATIFMQRARWKRDTQGAIVYEGDVALREPVPLVDAAAWEQDACFPAFSSRAGADVLFAGFMREKQDVRGVDRTGLPQGTADAKAGWFVVFQEQPTEPRFGPPAVPATANATKAETLAVQLMRPAYRLFVHASDLVSA
ncbi:hypothetical protein LJR130_007092 [Variovorax sp. LjRoot130]|uniref:hypothetical protein n=1 Tax=Variovorax sp. LjRoot130 TaxID=3342261 RepID=UPI003ECEEC2E